MFPPAQPGVTIQLGRKDVRLFREAGRSTGFYSGLAGDLTQELQTAIDAGTGEQDWPASTHRQPQQQLS